MKKVIQDTGDSKEGLLTVLVQMAACLLQQDAHALAEDKSEEPQPILSANKEATNENRDS